MEPKRISQPDRRTSIGAILVYPGKFNDDESYQWKLQEKSVIGKHVLSMRVTAVRFKTHRLVSRAALTRMLNTIKYVLVMNKETFEDKLVSSDELIKAKNDLERILKHPSPTFKVRRY